MQQLDEATKSRILQEADAAGAALVRIQLESNVWWPFHISWAPAPGGQIPLRPSTVWCVDGSLSVDGLQTMKRLLSADVPVRERLGELTALLDECTAIGKGA